MIGLGVMGRNLLLNMADHGFSVIGFDKDLSKATSLESFASPGTTVKGVSTLSEMVKQLKRPRKIMMLVPAGPIVDYVINDLLPLVEENDIIIDGGNSHYTDTLNRIKFLEDKKIHFVGMGVSGGEHGARTGPSIMPGGDVEAWKELKQILEAISAKVNNEPCVAYMGKNAAGHYVKMVHNGIEYAIMQLISEVYDVLKRSMGLNNDELHEVFKKWNEGEMNSFLLEITSGIFLKKDDQSNKRLVDMILDKAGSKGTGKWTSQDAMNLPVPVPTIDMAVAMRDISVYKDERVNASTLYNPKIKPITKNKEKILQQLHDGLYAATILCYAQGLAMLHKASSELNMDISLKDVVRIWRGGCIIRSSLLEMFTTAFKKNSQLPNILLNKKVASLIKKKIPALRKIVSLSTASRIPAAGLASALSYFDAYCSENLPTNLIQAQRDYFGAHTYQRIDQEGNFHTEW
ncbi:MAG: NADP-dependent phosphogluconate dehydrogenase [Bacteroidetes bacterium]|nr:NADP-dependent phosphogluconate dehydrogenase [Bacteroidota bacterium]MBS1929966.1 NADP-dependent phosphogluconate dehydrogenase [Bacteroidota bacterium]